VATARTDLRPLSLGELLDEPFTLYRNHFWLFVGIMAIPQTATGTFTLVLQSWMDPFVVAPRAGATPPAPAEMARVMGGFLGGVFVLLLVHFTMYAIALGATTFVVSDVYLGRTASVRGAYRNMGRRVPALLGLVLIVFMLVSFCYFTLSIAGAVSGGLLVALAGPAVGGIAMVLGVLAGVGATVWLSLHFGVSIPVLLLEKAGIFQAIKRSFLLIWGNAGRVFLAVLLMALITYEFVGIFQGPFLVMSMESAGKGAPLAFWIRGLSAIAGTLVGTLIGPLLMIALSLLYYDVRVRKEAFDLQVMMAALDAATPASAAPPTAPIPTPMPGS